MFGRKKSTVVIALLFYGIWPSAVIAATPYIFVNGLCGNDAWTGKYSHCSAPDGYKRTIQAALDAIPNGGVVAVRDGIYAGDGNRDLDFKGKAVRLVCANGPDACTIDCGGTPSEEHRAFYFHSVETETSVVQGFTITNGRAWKGGAVLCQNSSPKFIDCTFEGNEATDDDTGGGAVYNEDSSPTFENCTFADNIAMPSASFGGGITNERSSPTVTDCTFTNNHAWGGGGIYNTDNSNPVLENCTFLNNQAARGAGMANSGCAPTLSRCTFTGNSASYYGGGINNLSESSPILSHCTFANNSARSGAGITNASSSPAIIINCLFVANYASDENGAAVSNDTSDAQLINCTIYGNSGGGIASFDNSRVTTTNTILWANNPSQVYNDDPACNQILFSCVEGGWSGAGNTPVDPLFADPDGPDDTLGTEDDDFSLTTGSACIDAGDNSVVPPTLLTDFAGLARFSDDLQTPDTGSGTPPVVDMGVREFQGLFYVDDTAVGANNGTSWANAFTSLQNALAAASAGAEIRVAQGLYAPDFGHGITRGDRNASFGLISEITIKGGYAGFGSSNPDDRNINEYRTILTGDLSSNDQTPADPAELLEHASRSENSFHVVKIGQDAQDVALHGFIITGGNANGDYSSGTDSGAGIYKGHYQNSAVIKDCTFIANCAENGGGGMLNGGPVHMDRCRFIGNAAESGGGMKNYAGWQDPADLTNCL
ncbi:MAG: right-handed parallel beta-helix repeat-containing protein, partial [Sedimentisphaerales bacterium]|nr:right-handed parallel beta-helix repeat-containing protein [Sedimentisphaerales bacterium]